MNDEEWSEYIAARIKKKIADNGHIKRKELARRSGLSEMAISYYMKGKRKPSAYTLVKMAQALNCTVDDLIMPNEPLD